MLGTFITDMSMGFYTAKFDRRTDRPCDDGAGQRCNITATNQSSFAISSIRSRRAKIRAETIQTIRNPHDVPDPLKKEERATAHDRRLFFAFSPSHLDEHCCVVADIGDAIFGAVGIRSAKQAQFIAPGLLHVDGLRRAGEHRHCDWPRPICALTSSSATALFK